MSKVPSVSYPRRTGQKGTILLIAILLIAMLAGEALMKPAQAEGEPALRYLFEWGEPGLGTGKFRAVRGIAAYDRAERPMIVVADAGADLIRSYTWNMMFIDKWGETGAEPGQFHEPRGVAIDSQGLLIVADAYNHRVQKTAIGTKSLLERPGSPLMSFGTRGNGEGQFDTPTGVGVDASGNILVVDTNNHRIQMFNSSGLFIKSWGSRGTGEGAFFMPSYVVTNSKGRIYVSDTGNHRVQVFDGDGHYLATVGGLGGAAGRFKEPKGLAVDAQDNLWVVDRRNHRLQKFDPEGNPLAIFGTQGAKKGEFSFPEGIAIDSGGRLYITDGLNSRIQVFRPK